MSVLDSSGELSKLLETWTGEQRNNEANFDPIPVLTRISEILEKETEAYYKMDPDPFDDRHPSRARPDCSLGVLLKMLFKNEDFMDKLVRVYIMHRDNVTLQTAASRLLIDLLPGLETSVVFTETEGLVEKLFERAEFTEEPLKSYSIGLLAAAMDVQDIAVNYKDQNMHLVPTLLRRLKDLSTGKAIDASSSSDKENKTSSSQDANLESPIVKSSSTSDSIVNPITVTETNEADAKIFERPFAVFKRTRSPDKRGDAESSTSTCGSLPSPIPKKRRISSPPFSPASIHTESNSSWADLEPLIVGSFKLHPLTYEMQQRFILQYLSPLGDYQELLYIIFDGDALGLIHHYIDIEKNHDIRLAFEALKYLSSLLCHKKFALEFLNRGGLQKLLQVYRPSVAATGVSICLYYLAYSAMERICLLPRGVLNDLVSYSLWLLECSHDSSRCHATMFFSFSFAFRIILEIFDSQDGLRKLLNAMFLLDIFADDSELNDDELIQKRQTARHVCVALKKYFEAHLVLEFERLRRNISSPTGIAPRSLSTSSNQSSSSTGSIGQGCKANRYSQEKIYEYVENLLELIPVRYLWKPVEELMKLGGVRLLITLVGASFSWGFTGKQEAIRSAMDVLVICSVVPKMQLLFKEHVTNEDNVNVPGMAIILSCLQPDRIMEDAEVAQAALRVVINCVCGAGSRHLSSSVSSQSSSHHHVRHPSTSSKKKTLLRSGLDHLQTMWKVVKENDGLPILLNLLTVRTPISDADAIRALSCKALTGLSNYEEVRQIIAKRPIFNNGQLQALMKEPVLTDKRSEHVKFIKYCVELIHQVTGSHPVIDSAAIDASTPENLNRAEVVAQTKIVFNEKQLFELMYDYLMKKGLKDTAKSLSKEAELSLSTSRIKPSPWPILTPTDTKGDRNPSFSCPTTPFGSTWNLSSSQSSLNSSFAVGGFTTAITSQMSISFKKHRPRLSRALSFMSKPIEGDGEGYTPSPVIKKMDSAASSQSSMVSTLATTAHHHPNKTITLDSIITEYLRKQHALCKNPIVTCPTFDLFTPHRCPEGRNLNTAPVSMPLRVQRKQILPRYGGVFGIKYDRKFVYSKFRPIRTFKEAEGAHSFTSCAFSYVDQYLFLGTTSGEMATFNLDSGSIVATYTCHDSEIKYIEPSKDGKSIITCSIWRHPISALWSFTDVFDMKMSFEDDFHVEFGKLYQDKALGTHHSEARLYDLNVGRKIGTFKDESISRKYLRNEATFSYTDELILNDGVLWDVRTSEVVHKFDKFNETINGVFHPNGFEIIANSEIWDMRTYRLLKTVPALDQCSIRFNPKGDVIYGAVFEADTPEDDEARSPYTSSFRTFDATDYSSIITIDVKKSICDLAVDPEDNFIAIIEMDSRREVMFSQDNVCRLYEVGRSKEEDEDDADEDEDDEDDDNDDDMDDEDSEDDILDTTDDLHQYGDFEGSSDDEEEEDGEDGDDYEDGVVEYSTSSSSSNNSGDEDGNDDDDEWTSIDEDDDGDSNRSDGNETDELSAFMNRSN